MICRRIVLHVVSLLALSWSSSRAAAAQAAPVVMESNAVTLELACSDGATEGEFHPIHARIIEASTWGVNQNSRADLTGYELQAGARRAKQAKKKKAAAQAEAITVLVTLKPEGDAALEIDTSSGKAVIRLQDVQIGAVKNYLEGKIKAKRISPATRLTESPSDNDYPSAARGPSGEVWVAYTAYQRGVEPDMQAAARHDFRTLVPTGNGDQIHLVKFDGKEWSAPQPVTEGLLDLWKPTVTVAKAGRVWVAWSQQSDGNWDVYRRSFDPAQNQWSPVERVTTDAGADINVVSATDSKGEVWWAWQGRRGKHFQIFLTGGGGQPIALTEKPANHWDPAIVADSKGNVYVAWDTYENGNYDIFMRRFHSNTSGSMGEPGPIIPVATLMGFEARPSLAVDRQDRVWIAYEKGGPNWGKDYGRMAPKSAGFPGPNAKDDYSAGAGRTAGGNGGNGVGIPLYLNREIIVKCFADGRLQQPAERLNSAFAGLDAPRRPKSHARITVAEDGRVWLLFRHHPLPGGPHETWAEYAMSYDGKTWSKPRMLADSDGILDNRPAIVPFGKDGALAVYNSDWRLRGANNVVGRARLPLKADLYGSVLRDGESVAAMQLAEAEAGSNEVKPVHPNEPKEIERMREYRVEAGGKTYQLARGEFHRHTEYTAHRDGDGTLEDMWRYALDAADMDWLGNGDHDNGFGHQYPWWITQKTMDIYHNPPWFIAPYTYERSNEWPNGHRNVIFTKRGVRALPRGDMKGTPEAGSPDTKMLYAYLHQFGGVCASHTSATNMGTDWRDNDPVVEPVVEVYQGDRNNYECEGRGITAQEVAAGHVGPNAGGEAVHPKGFIWNALAKGYRLGFESSSDHISSHSSYAVVLVEKPGREAIVEAFRARRCFAATDNIALVVKCGDHLMGEEFQLAGQPIFDIHAAGTAKITRLEVVRNNRYVFSTAPERETVDLKWTDTDPPSEPFNYYYVRIQQADGNLAWCSPMWVHPKEK